MDVLEKILEEIDRLDELYYKGYICKYDVQDIIRNHFPDAKKMVGDWIPVEEVCKMLKDMQIKVLKCQGFFDGHISQVWAVDHLLGEKLEALGGGGVQKEHDKDTGETRYVWES